MNFTTDLPVGVSPKVATTSRDLPVRRPLQLESILVPVDLSESSRTALRHAVPMALQFGARLTLLHVVEPSLTAPLNAHSADAARNRLAELYDEEVAPELTAKTVVRHGCIYDQILAAAREEHADLIVTTTHGRTGLRHLLSGSTAECIVHGAPCAVLVVREPEEDAEPM